MSICYKVSFYCSCRYVCDLKVFRAFVFPLSWNQEGSVAAWPTSLWLPRCWELGSFSPSKLGELLCANLVVGFEDFNVYRYTFIQRHVYIDTRLYRDSDCTANFRLIGFFSHGSSEWVIWRQRESKVTDLAARTLPKRG